MSKASDGHSSTELPTVPKQPRQSQHFCLHILCRESLQVSVQAVTCSPGEHIDRGTRWGSRPRGSSLSSFRKSCWRWWRRFTLQGDKKYPITSLITDFSYETITIKENCVPSRDFLFSTWSKHEDTGFYLFFWFIQINPTLFLLIPNNLKENHSQKQRVQSKLLKRFK